MGILRIILVMGVAGSGKSTVGARLAARLDAKFFDADDFHPPANVAKMRAGVPLSDADREPWLARLRQEVIDATPEGNRTVLVCSALKKIYRQRLGVGSNDVHLVYLQGTATLLAERLRNRQGHFMRVGMLESQLAVLEEPLPDEGITLQIELGVDELVEEILQRLPKK